MRFDGETEHPDVLIQEGLQRSALHRVPLPQPNYETPIPENTPGFFAKAFPHIFLSGDADPYQPRPVDIKKPKSSWEEKYLSWMVAQPEAQE